MGLQAEGDAVREFERARHALDEENTVTALGHLERALDMDANPCWHSYLGYCIAKERGQVARGVELCRSSLQLEPDNPVHYLNLGRVYLVSGNKEDALRVLRQGMAKGEDAGLLRQLRDLGSRKPPVLSFLSRSNPVNKYLGLLLSRLGLR